MGLHLPNAPTKRDRKRAEAEDAIEPQGYAMASGRTRRPGIPRTSSDDPARARYVAAILRKRGR